MPANDPYQDDYIWENMGLTLQFSRRADDKIGFGFANYRAQGRPPRTVGNRAGSGKWRR